MKKRTEIILTICLALVLLLGIGGYAYISDYYHADETALAVMPIKQVKCRSSRTEM